MEAHVSELYKLLKLNNTTFSIPVYQRNYEWEKANCEQFFYDIENIAKTGKSHFIGSITYVSVGRAYDPYFTIVDGQQRITTAFLFLKAISDSSDNQRLKMQIRNGFLVNNDYDSTPKLKLKQIEADSSVFERLMFQEEFDEKPFTDTEKQTCIYCNYTLFRERILDSAITLENLLDAFYKLQFIEVCLDGREDEDAQAIFESMNSTGKNLSSTDLLRNFFLMNMKRDAQEYMYKNYWAKTEENVGKENMEQFVTQYIIMKRRNNNVSHNGKKTMISSKNLYDVFKLYVADRSQENIREILSDMLHFSVICRKLLYKNKRKTDIEKSAYELINELNCLPAMIFLMYLYSQYEQEYLRESELLSAIHACIAYVTRSRVMNGKPSSQFFSLCIQNYEKAEGSPETRIWTALSAGRGSYRLPDDNEFRTALCTKNMYLDYKPQFIRYFLYKYEERRTKEVVEREDATIEHIMPQNTSHWREELKAAGDTEYNDYIHKLGNLTLTKINPELSNKTFAEKKTDYNKSNYTIAREICDYPEWNSRYIRSRTESMADEAIRIWPVPKIEMKEENILSVMSSDARDLYEMLVETLRETYVDIDVSPVKYYVNVVRGRNIFFSIIPFSDCVKITFRKKPLKMDGVEELTNTHYGTGNYRFTVKNEDDIGAFLNIFKSC